MSERPPFLQEVACGIAEKAVKETVKGVGVLAVTTVAASVGFIPALVVGGLYVAGVCKAHDALTNKKS